MEKQFIETIEELLTEYQNSGIPTSKDIKIIEQFISFIKDEVDEDITMKPIKNEESYFSGKRWWGNRDI